MVNRQVAERKLSKLKGYLEELSEYQNLSWDDYLAAFPHRRTVERLIQLIVDVAVDINTHAVVDAKQQPPADSFDSFLRAAKLGLFPVEFAKKIAPSTGERNIIVHEYEKIDDALVYHSIREALSMYRQYLTFVRDYLEQV
ncbi:MAG: hypothetical protein DDT21_00806 [Syntrophomonadaceae bacterium]|nr:hypothetical protein [Bacillota bacterium]